MGTRGWEVGTDYRHDLDNHAPELDPLQAGWNRIDASSRNVRLLCDGQYESLASSLRPRWLDNRSLSYTMGTPRTAKLFAVSMLF